MLLAASLPEMFAYGATGFWIAVVAFVIWMMLATSYEHNFAASLSVIAFCVFLQVIGVDVLGPVYEPIASCRCDYLVGSDWDCI